AVQQRAQELMDTKRVRSKFRVTPIRALVTLAIAVIPVLLTYAAVDGVLRGMHMIEAMYDKQDAEEAARAAKMAPPEEPLQHQRGVVMLKPLREKQPAPAGEGSPPTK